MKANITLNLTTLILVGIIIVGLFFGGWKIYQNRVNNLNDKLETEIKLKDALLDSVYHFQNREKEWVAEKLTIQETIKNLEKINGQLTQSQKDLLVRIKEIEKVSNIIAAALIQSNVKLDSLIHKGETVVDTTKHKVTFRDLYKDGKKEVRYSFTVGNVLPSPLTAIPSLRIDSLYFPNTQFIEFHWKKDKKAGYPVAFSVSNSNDFFKTVNVDSYAIPALSKEVLNPNGWQKISNFFVRNGNTLIKVGVGVVVGGMGYWYLTK